MMLGDLVFGDRFKRLIKPFKRRTSERMPKKEQPPEMKPDEVSSQNDGAVDKLKGRMRKTAQSRFFAAKRLQTRDRKITRLTAMCSAYLIGLTALPYFLHLPELVEDYVNLVALVTAVIVLVSSLLQYSRLDVVSAEQHHRCGLEINELLREYDGPGAHDYYELADSYNEILQKYSINHDDVDFWSVTLDRPEEYPWLKGWTKFWRQFVVIAGKFGPDAVLATVTIALLAFLLLYVFPKQTPQPQSSGSEILMKIGR